MVGYKPVESGLVCFKYREHKWDLFIDLQYASSHIGNSLRKSIEMLVILTSVHKESISFRISLWALFYPSPFSVFK